jgi:hypothetical protein
LENVEVVASFSSADGTLVKSGSALIDFNPLLPGQSSAAKRSGPGSRSSHRVIDYPTPLAYS